MVVYQVATYQDGKLINIDYKAYHERRNADLRLSEVAQSDTKRYMNKYYIIETDYDNE